MKAQLRWHWPFWARPNQLAPDGDWRTWVALAGRGFGKTEAGAQWVRQRVEAGARKIALVAETQKDLEEVMVARILAVHPPEDAPTVRYRPVRLRWPNGAVALGYNGTEPNQLRGPEFDTAWLDELAKYRYARETWDMLKFTMRSGDDPRKFVTTTPRPIKVLKEILADQTTVISRGSTFDNAGNLPKEFLNELRRDYEGTRLGRQELFAEVIDEAEGALWTRDMLDSAQSDSPPEMKRIVVAIDPAVTDNDYSDETGIIAAGLGVDDRGYVLHDRSGRYSPRGWAQEAISLADEIGADRIIAEVNNGGDMIKSTIRTEDPSASVKTVHASKGKRARAEPVAALYEQRRVSHVRGLSGLEDQLVAWEPLGDQRSPDRLDAMVWALTELMLDKPEPFQWYVGD